MDSQKGEARIIDAAELLFAERGLDGVTTREILDAAGQKNQSALQYHFGSREGLILALLEDRFARIDARRLAIFAARAKGNDALRSLLQAIVLPLAEEVNSRPGGDAFIRVLAQIVHRPSFDITSVLKSSKFEGLRRIDAEMDKQLTHLPRAERALRSRMVISLFVGTLAGWSQYHRHAVPYDAMVSGLLEALRGLVMLGGPRKAQTKNEQ